MHLSPGDRSGTFIPGWLSPVPPDLFPEGPIPGPLLPVVFSCHPNFTHSQCVISKCSTLRFIEIFTISRLVLSLSKTKQTKKGKLWHCIQSMVDRYWTLLFCDFHGKIYPYILIGIISSFKNNYTIMVIGYRYLSLSSLRPCYSECIELRLDFCILVTFCCYLVKNGGLLVRWLRVIFRRDVYRMEESMKFGTTNHFGVRNKFSLVATWFDDPRGKTRHFNSW